jgi:hypothetical protein
MIGDKAAAACEIKPKPEHNCRFNEPLTGHMPLPDFSPVAKFTQVRLRRRWCR